jgi:hypothetical protein
LTDGGERAGGGARVVAVDDLPPPGAALDTYGNFRILAKIGFGFGFRWLFVCGIEIVLKCILILIFQII